MPNKRAQKYLIIVSKNRFLLKLSTINFIFIDFGPLNSHACYSIHPVFHFLKKLMKIIDFSWQIFQFHPLLLYLKVCFATFSIFHPSFFTLAQASLPFQILTYFYPGCFDYT